MIFKVFIVSVFFLCNLFPVISIAKNKLVVIQFESDSVKSIQETPTVTSAGKICMDRNLNAYGSKMMATGNQTGVGMRVLWTVSDYIISQGGPWGESEARSMLFKPLDLDSSSITFNGETCQGISFKSERVETDQYLSERWSVTPEMLGISAKSIKVIKTNCPLPGFSEFIRLPDRRLIVRIKYVFFFFEPNVNY